MLAAVDCVKTCIDKGNKEHNVSQTALAVATSLIFTRSSIATGYKCTDYTATTTTVQLVFTSAFEHCMSIITVRGLLLQVAVSVLGHNMDENTRKFCVIS